MMFIERTNSNAPTASASRNRGNATAARTAQISPTKRNIAITPSVPSKSSGIIHIERPKSRVYSNKFF